MIIWWHCQNLKYLTKLKFGNKFEILFRNLGVKVKVIFLDIDGVLNGWDLSEYVKYNIWNIIHFKKIKDFIRSLSHYTDIDKKRVRRLGKICNKTGAQVVLSSSWRNGLLHHTGIRHYDSDRNKLFWDLIDKYHIEVIHPFLLCISIFLLCHT